jgi:hypothetical protein
VNASAPTAGGAGLLTPLPLHSVGWHRLSPGRSVTWHDNRVRALPQGIDQARWRIPLIVDGKSAPLQGDLWRVAAPAWWPWLAMGVPFVLISLLLYLRRRSAVRSAAAAFGLVAAAGLVASGTGFAFDTYASNGKWVELGNELAVVLVGLAVIARGSQGARGIAGGGAGVAGPGGWGREDSCASARSRPIDLLIGPATSPGRVDNLVRRRGHPARPGRL